MKLPILIFASLVASGACAQVVRSSPTVDQPPAMLNVISATNAQFPRNNDAECLIRRADRARICRSRAQWRLIAARLEQRVPGR